MAPGVTESITESLTLCRSLEFSTALTNYNCNIQASTQANFLKDLGLKEGSVACVVYGGSLT